MSVAPQQPGIMESLSFSHGPTAYCFSVSFLYACMTAVIDCCLQKPVLLPMVSEWLTQIPAGRLAEVEDLQAAVVYLASDASTYMVGHELVIDGGHSMW